MTYLFACGGSGGHIFPALSVAEELARRDPTSRVIYACGTKDIESAIFRVVPKDAVFTVDSAPFRGGASFVDPGFLIRLAKGFFQSRALLKKLKPALVVGFGGYVSFPVLMAARSLRVRTALHEQNVIPGRANRVLASWVEAVALSHEETRRHFKRCQRSRVTGNPIRSSIEEDRRQEALHFFGFSQAKKILLVLGGSQGAESVNHLFLGALPFLGSAAKDLVQVLHLCGRMEPRDSEEACRRQGVSVRSFSFFDRMDLAYGAADLCLGRAGATFLAEIEAKGIPAILIPYPFADGHQRENARVFSAHGRAVVAEQKDLTPEHLARLIEEMIDRCREGSAVKERPTRPNARAALADFLEEYAKAGR